MPIRAILKCAPQKWYYGLVECFDCKVSYCVLLGGMIWFFAGMIWYARIMYLKPVIFFSIILNTWKIYALRNFFGPIVHGPKLVGEEAHNF